MNTKLILIAMVGLYLSLDDAAGQGVLNGDFELYNREATFLPAWNVVLHTHLGDVDFSTTLNGSAGSNIRYEFADTAIGGPSVNTPFDVAGLKGGNFFFWANNPGVNSVTELKQEVVIPEEVNSLQFRAFRGFVGYLSVRLNGNLETQIFKNPVDVDPLHGYVGDWWIDVSKYRNQTVDLSFSVNIQTGLDDIRLSSERVPEPNVLAFGALGLAMLMARRRSAGARTLLNS